jgi:hypothetical protein
VRPVIEQMTGVGGAAAVAVPVVRVERQDKLEYSRVVVVRVETRSRVVVEVGVLVVRWYVGPPTCLDDVQSCRVEKRRCHMADTFFMRSLRCLRPQLTESCAEPKILERFSVYCVNYFNTQYRVIEDKYNDA